MPISNSTRRKYYDERRRWVTLKHKYGITEEQYKTLKHEQGSVCAICKRPKTEIYKGTVLDLSVDHCHVTGQVRGLLCRQCNIALGRFQESIEVLNSAIVYLSRYTERKEEPLWPQDS